MATEREIRAAASTLRKAISQGTKRNSRIHKEETARWAKDLAAVTSGPCKSCNTLNITSDQDPRVGEIFRIRCGSRRSITDQLYKGSLADYLGNPPECPIVVPRHRD